MKERFNTYLFQISAIAVLLSTALFLIEPFYMRYLFAVGAAGMAISRLSQRYEGDNLRLKRLLRLQKMSPLFLIIASYLMFKPHNQWIPLVLASAFMELYTAFMISREEKKSAPN
ncbi:MAG: hypothetical protein ACRCSQ_02075 [Bacteroidales bacterium]